MEERLTEMILLTLHHQEVYIALFLARAFKDISTIWYLKDLTLSTLKRQSNRKFYKILRDLEEEGQPKEAMIAIPTKRNHEEEYSDQPESKRWKFGEFELDEDF